MAYKILIVNEEKELRDLFRGILEVEYEVSEAANGRDAIKKIKAPNVIDLVVLDVNLPELQGTEVLKTLKQINPRIFIVMLSGGEGKGVIIEALRGGADDYLEKPVTTDHLLKTIKRLLSRKNARPRGVIGKVKYFIENNYHKEITLKEAAGLVCLNPKYLSRIFKEKTGMGFTDYKLHLRVEKAKDLLDNSDMRINEIAYKVGYRNPESFIRVFKKEQDCTPVEYRSREVEFNQ